jgi:hypothetical protein
VRRTAALALAALAACSPVTSRPTIVPLPASPTLDVKGKPPEIAERLLKVLEAEGIPLARASAVDGYAETPWVDAETFQPVTRRPIGAETVRLRAWVDRGPPNYSVVTLETAFRAEADPSMRDRELDRPVPADHPAQARMKALLEKVKTAR